MDRNQSQDASEYGGGIFSETTHSSTFLADERNCGLILGAPGTGEDRNVSPQRWCFLRFIASASAFEQFGKLTTRLFMFCKVNIGEAESVFRNPRLHYETALATESNALQNDIEQLEEGILMFSLA
jgi:hypothetical protein